SVSHDEHINIPAHHLLADVLGMAPEELHPHNQLQHYGFDSISCIQLLQLLQSKVDPLVTLAELQASQTVRDMTDVIAKKQEDAYL
ncbi:acyl carrier protein, partial [Bacillus spizizenii]|uniref:acyl carrier protein n=1 Tax=Bacillus spizizenii TaxID=96241 RepID=UPI001F60D2E4